MEDADEKALSPHHSLSPQFRTELGELCRRGDRSIAQVAEDFTLLGTAVRHWADWAEGELTRLREQNRELREEVETLKRAVALFSKESR